MTKEQHVPVFLTMQCQSIISHLGNWFFCYNSNRICYSSLANSLGFIFIKNKRGRHHDTVDKVTTRDARIQYGHGCSIYNPAPCGSTWESSGGQPECLGSCMHMGDREEVPDSWVSSWSSPGCCGAIWRVNQQMNDFSLSHSPLSRKI